MTQYTSSSFRSELSRRARTLQPRRGPPAAHPDLRKVINYDTKELGKGVHQLLFGFEKAQDQYLALMQNIADIAFELLLDTGLAESGDKKTLASWRVLGIQQPQVLAKSIGHDWLDTLMTPSINENISDPVSFAQKHNEILMLKAQEQFGSLNENKDLHDASVLMMSVALHGKWCFAEHQTRLCSTIFFGSPAVQDVQNMREQTTNYNIGTTVLIYEWPLAGSEIPPPSSTPITYKHNENARLTQMSNELYGQPHAYE